MCTYTPMKDTKYCFVPTCKNNYTKHNSKNFISIPTSAKHEWCNAVGVGCPKRVLYICEDYLNLVEDLENYCYWTTMKRLPILKTGVPKSLQPSSSNVTSILLDEINPSTSSATFLKVDKQSWKIPQSAKCHERVQVKLKTADRTTYCSIYKIKRPLPDEDQVPIESVHMEEAIPSTQGSTTSAHVSEVSSNINVNCNVESRGFMLRLIEKKPQNYIGLPKKFYWLIDYLETELGS